MMVLAFNPHPTVNCNACNGCSLVDLSLIQIRKFYFLEQPFNSNWESSSIKIFLTKMLIFCVCPISPTKNNLTYSIKIPEHAVFYRPVSLNKSCHSLHSLPQVRHQNENMKRKEYFFGYIFSADFWQELWGYLNKIAMKSFSKNCRSESTLNCRFHSTHV